MIIDNKLYLAKKINRNNPRQKITYFPIGSYRTLEICGTNEIYVYLKSKHGKKLTCISKDGISFTDESIFFINKELKLLLEIMCLIS